MATHERVNEKTPSGGDYSEIFYLNEKHDLVEPENATECIINEYLADGTLIHTTYGVMNN
ncbi:MAG: hypothetical protein J6M64_06335 [Oscillospiraceae bacterium]|nr:hypothetical protein [Oscillospiraceae bacterium]